MPEQLKRELDRLADEILVSRRDAPDDPAALAARHDLWVRRESLRIELVAVSATLRNGAPHPRVSWKSITTPPQSPTPLRDKQTTKARR